MARFSHPRTANDSSANENVRLGDANTFGGHCDG